MMPPCLIINEKLINPLRTLIIHKMYEDGLSQTEIAKKLNLSQVSVNRYLRKDPEEIKIEILKLGIDSNRLDIYVKNILRDIYLNSDSFTLCLMCKELRLHEFYFGSDLDLVKYLDNERNIHENIYELKTLITEDMLNTLSELNREAHRLEKIIKFSKIIPPYGSDFIFSLPEPDSINEIAGLPSRIINYHGKPRILIGPEFGHDSEISHLLIKLSDYNFKIRSGITILNNEALLSFIKKHYDINIINFNEIKNFKRNDDLIFVNKDNRYVGLPLIFLFSTNPENIVNVINDILIYY